MEENDIKSLCRALADLFSETGNPEEAKKVIKILISMCHCIDVLTQEVEILRAKVLQHERNWEQEEFP